LTCGLIVDIIFFKYREAKARDKKGNCVMSNSYSSKLHLISTISYIISRIILLAVLGILLSNLVLSITGIILIVVQLIISTLIIGLIISLIQIINNLITIKTMTGKSKQILFIQRVEVGANP
jgi:hypothetical protein